VDNQSHPQNSSEQLAYQSLFLLMDDGIVIIDHQHKIIQLNPVAVALLQIPEDKAIGQVLDDVIYHQHQIELSLDNLPDDPIALQMNDETHYYKLKLKQLSDQAGYVVIFDDVTNEQNALHRVDQLQAAYSDYAHTVGHDVKSPLGVAIGYSNMLQSELEEGTEAHIFADEIFNTSMRIMYICNELLLLSELQNPRIKVEFAPVNLNSVLDTVLRRFTKAIANQDITVKFAETMPIVKGNLPWIEEVLVDFCHHAILDRSPTTIEIGTEIEAHGIVRVWVKHDGHELSHDEQETLFDITRNLENIRAEGHGLGLDVAKLLIEKLQGTVGVDGGQMIYFTLRADEVDG